MVWFMVACPAAWQVQELNYEAMIGAQKTGLRCQHTGFLAKYSAAGQCRWIKDLEESRERGLIWIKSQDTQAARAVAPESHCPAGELFTGERDRIWRGPSG